jgi:hypothetical protein
LSQKPAVSRWPTVDFPGTASIRVTALTAAGISHQLSTDGRTLILERDVPHFSKHQQDVIQWVRNPLAGLDLLNGLDLPVAKAVVQALKKTYLDGNGTW